MARTQIIASFFIYLTISVHAIRVHQMQGLTPTALAETSKLTPYEARMKFERKVSRFFQHPSMKIGGTAAKLARFWMKRSVTNKKGIAKVLSSSIDALGTGASGGVAWQLQKGLNNWFAIQQSKHPERTEYRNCVFSIQRMQHNVNAKLDIETIATIAPAVLEGSNGEQCELREKFREMLVGKPWWLRAMIGNKDEGSASEDDLQRMSDLVEVAEDQDSMEVEEDEDSTSSPVDSAGKAITTPVSASLVDLSTSHEFMDAETALQELLLNGTKALTQSHKDNLFWLFCLLILMMLGLGK